MFDWFKDWWDDAMEYFSDLPIRAVAGILEGIADVVLSVPVPQFLDDGVGVLLGALSPDVLYFLGQIGLPQGLALIGAGVAFRVTRKIVTFGLW